MLAPTGTPSALTAQPWYKVSTRLFGEGVSRQKAPTVDLKHCQAGREDLVEALAESELRIIRVRFMDHDLPNHLESVCHRPLWELAVHDGLHIAK